MLARQNHIAPRIVRLYHAPSDRLHYIRRIIDGRTVTLLAFKAFETWEEIEFTAGRVNYADGTDPAEGGRLAKQELSLIYSGDDLQTDSALRLIGHQRHLVRVVYENQEEFVVGDPNAPMRLSYAWDQSQLGYRLVFSRNTPN